MIEQQRKLLQIHEEDDDEEDDEEEDDDEDAFDDRIQIRVNDRVLGTCE